MGKKRAKVEKEKNKAEQLGTQPRSTGRRRTLIGIGSGVALGLVGLGGYRAGWFGREEEEATTAPGWGRKAARPLPPLELAATQAGAIQAATEIVTHYTRALDNASAGIHAVRAMGCVRVRLVLVVMVVTVIVIVIVMVVVVVVVVTVMIVVVTVMVLVEHGHVGLGGGDPASQHGLERQRVTVQR